MSENGANQESVIQEFYNGSCVLVTGGSGFMGKVLVEKLLRSCPGISRIFLLLRTKRGVSGPDRVDKLLSSPCFEGLLNENPKLKSKLVAVSGDISKEKLDLAEGDAHLLREHVDIVFHVAANVRFNDPLQDAIFQNVRGTREVLSLAKTFRKLKSFVHVSTAFSNCPLNAIDEAVYEPPLDCVEAIEMAEMLNSDELDKNLKSILGKWPNTYSYTKAISEHTVKFYGKNLPVGIVRPSIVLTCKEEPMPGWCDSPYGPMGFSIAMATGAAKTLFVDESNVCNFVPCDLVINCIIAAAWDIHNKRGQEDTPVYNSVTPRENNHVSWRRCYELLVRDANTFPPSTSLWYISCFFTTNRWLTFLLRLLLHFLPALFIDIISTLTFGKRRMVRMYKKLHTVSDACFYFTSFSWDFEVKNVDEMWEKMDSKSKRLFPFDFRALDWTAFYTVYWHGVRKYLLQDSDDTLPQAKSMYFRLYILHCFIKILFIGLAFWCLWITSQAAISRLI